MCAALYCILFEMITLIGRAPVQLFLFEVVWRHQKLAHLHCFCNFKLSLIEVLL